MSDEFSQGTGGGAVRRPWPLTALSIVLFIEAAMLAGAAVFLFYELVTEVPTSYGSAIAILVLVALAAVWLVIVALNTLRLSPWIRSAALTWQVLQLAIAAGSFQGLFARNDIGWFLLVPALVALFLLFTKSVMAATRRV